MMLRWTVPVVIVRLVIRIRKAWRMTKYKWFILLFVVVTAVSLAIAMLRTNIILRKQEAKQYPMMLAKLSDENVDPANWGVSFPSQYEGYLSTRDDTTFTPYGGSQPYSKLLRYPQLTRLWGGYAFAVDFNEERGHYYSQIDQLETKRNDKEYLNAHGLPKFTGQPGACMNCHSGWTPKLIREMGWLEFNKTPYKEIVEKLRTDVGHGHSGSELGSTCADCHHPDDMSLRVTRPGYINAMVKRGYTADEKVGLLATRQEMRSHVCQQCHVEYYFQPPSNELTFPWSNWPKGEGFRIEMLDTYYDNARKQPDGFMQDWTHAETGAPMLKMQHPETELFSSGIHARSGVTCADCHMPFKRDGAIKVSNHHIRSPLNDVRSACGTCHNISEDELKQRVSVIQTKVASSLRRTEGAILALMDDIVAAKQAASDVDPAVLEAALSEPREMHRKASMRWDFIASENSTGFHSPQEAERVLGQAMDLARRGQILLANNLQEHGVRIALTTGAGKIPAEGEVIGEHHPPVGAKPHPALRQIDQNNS